MHISVSYPNIYHIEPDTKIWHFQNNFLEWKRLYFDLDIIIIFS